MRKKALLIVIIVSSILNLSGCWDSYEISNHSIVTATGLDINNNKTKFFVEYRPGHKQLPDVKNKQNIVPNLLTGEGDSIADAMNSIYRNNEDDLYLGANRAVVFSDNYAKNGITEYLNYIRGLRDYRKTINLFTTNTELEKLFSSKDLNTDNVGFDINHMSEQLTEKGLNYEATIAIILEEMQEKNTGYLLDNIEVIDKRMQMSGYSIFKDNKKIGLIDGNNIKGINYLILNNADGNYTLDFEGQKINFLNFLENKNIEATYVNNELSFNIDIDINSEFTPLSSMMKIDDEKTKLLEYMVSDKVKNDILEALNTSQKIYECDYLLLYKYFKSKYNTEYKNMNWNDVYKKAKFDVTVEAKVFPSNAVNYK